MESDKGSGETIPMSVVNENDKENEPVDVPPVSSNSAISANGETTAIDISGNEEGDAEHVKKSLTQQEAVYFNLDLPDYLENPPDVLNEKGASDKKDAAGTDAPDGFNDYRNKKTLTQGMMDVALFSANINQLRTMLDQLSLDDRHRINAPLAYIIIFMLIMSILLQVGIGLLLLLSTRYNVNNVEERRMAYKYGNYVVAGIFLVTVINVFISAFGNPNDTGGGPRNLTG